MTESSSQSGVVDSVNHEHRDCGARERLWLPKESSFAASAAQHPYCVSCGTVRSIAVPRARALGFYLDGLANLKEYLSYSANHEKMVEVQGHLIVQRLAAGKEFEDPYGTPGRVQMDAYVEAVRSVRPDVDEELVVRMLPSNRRIRRTTKSQEERKEVA